MFSFIPNVLPAIVGQLILTSYLAIVVDNDKVVTDIPSTLAEGDHPVPKS